MQLVGSIVREQETMQGHGAHGENRKPDVGHGEMAPARDRHRIARCPEDELEKATYARPEIHHLCVTASWKSIWRTGCLYRWDRSMSFVSNALEQLQEADAWQLGRRPCSR